MAAPKKARSQPSGAARTEGRLRRAEHRVEEAVKDIVAEVENRVILAGEAADESTSSEVNVLSTLEVAIHPPSTPKKRKAPKKR